MVDIVAPAVECPPHSWLVETPNGPLSLGRCKKCGAERVYKNWLYEENFNRHTVHDWLFREVLV